MSEYYHCPNCGQDYRGAAICDNCGQVVPLRNADFAPSAAEVICDLDLMAYEVRGLLVSYTLRGERRRRAQLADAAQLLDKGTPFIFDGRRIPGKDG